jgi:hypothetical protein
MQQLLSTDVMPTSAMAALVYVIKWVASLRQQWTIKGRDNENGYVTRMAMFSVLLEHMMNANASVLLRGGFAYQFLQYEQTFAKCWNKRKEDLDLVVNGRLNMVCELEQFDIVAVEGVFAQIFADVVGAAQIRLPSRMQVTRERAIQLIMDYTSGAHRAVNSHFVTYKAKFDKPAIYLMCLAYKKEPPVKIECFERKTLYLQGARSTVKGKEDDPHFLRIHRESRVDLVRAMWQQAKAMVAAEEERVECVVTEEDVAITGCAVKIEDTVRDDDVWKEAFDDVLVLREYYLKK